jgi:hypothetical protein
LLIKSKLDSGNTFQVLGNTGSVLLSANAAGITFAAGSAAAPSITTNNDTNTGIFFPAADTLAFCRYRLVHRKLDDFVILLLCNLQTVNWPSIRLTAAVAISGCRAWVNFQWNWHCSDSWASGERVVAITDNGTGRLHGQLYQCDAGCELFCAVDNQLCHEQRGCHWGI